MHFMQFANMEQLDGFFAAIPPDLHVAWGKRFGEHVVDGSPVWHVMRACPIRVPAKGIPKETSGGYRNRGNGSGAEDDAVVAAAATAIEKEAAKGGFTLPAKVMPRAPRSPSPEQLRQPVFDADDFGEAAITSTGGLVFPSSADLDAASMDDMFSAAAAAASATTTTTAVKSQSAQDEAAISAAPAAAAAAITSEPKSPFDVVNRLSDDPFGDNDLATTDINLDDYPEGSYVVTDWKGEPMVITPGDKIPGIM
mmetsp:Transcript_28046/g.44953  ORF Transcript_28046/g.44953 Transcript_28046/m.44953 type:complete len:253 (-) Transcript_28046:40-798(-)